jgi:NAD(P)-dependent dehydrogenase (short-subunit alcohol dehydrogenase family)
MDALRAIVTGASSGLGAAVAIGLATPGAKLVVNYASSREGAELTGDRCRSAGAEVILVQGDVSQDKDCRKIASAAGPWGGLDALINNAGVTKHIPFAPAKYPASDAAIADHENLLVFEAPRLVAGYSLPEPRAFRLAHVAGSIRRRAGILDNANLHGRGPPERRRRGFEKRCDIGAGPRGFPGKVLPSQHR